MRIRDCPAAVSGNEHRHQHWLRGSWEATASRSAVPRASPARKSEDLPTCNLRECEGTTPCSVSSAFVRSYPCAASGGRRDSCPSPPPGVTRGRPALPAAFASRRPIVRVEAYGTVDELNAALGFARSICDERRDRRVSRAASSASCSRWARRSPRHRTARSRRCRSTPAMVERLTAEVHRIEAIEGMLSGLVVVGRPHGSRRVQHGAHGVSPRRAGRGAARRVGRGGATGRSSRT